MIPVTQDFRSAAVLLHQRTSVNKPALLRWAGSKKQILPEIKRYWKKDFKRYVEPFCGSASLYFDLQPNSALLSDLNGDLTNALAQIKSNHIGISDKLSYMCTEKDVYYSIRALNPLSLSSEDRAVRFIYLNSLCFNGLYRVNKAGGFNVPYGSKHRKELFDPEALRATAEILQNAEISSGDFEASVDKAAAGDFVYLDPPYATASSRIFTQYQNDAFSRTDISRLNHALTRASARGAKFVLSYADVPEVECFDASWTVSRVSARRNISGFSGSRKTITEVLISNIKVDQ